MLALAFDQRKLPRTMKRGEWRRIDRWRRITQKEIAAVAEKRRALFASMAEEIAMFGMGRADYFSKVACPPLLLGPYMDRNGFDGASIRPGHVTYIMHAPVETRLP